MFPAPHGAVCAALLPRVMQANVQAARRLQPSGATLSRYDEIARLATGNPAARADDGVQWVRELVADLHIPMLAAYGIRREHIGGLVEKAAQASSMKANPVPLAKTELAEILERSL
jgi:alcohol dehydrogenase class IV